MRILYVTTISLTINSFFKPCIEMLAREGCHVDIACNQKDLALQNVFSELGCVFYQIDFSRSPLDMDNIKAYKQLKTVIDNGDYDIVHCHTPVAAMCTRLACRKARRQGTKVFYTAHGFHFYKGAPLKNWLLYYPVEKLCSHWTDTLITINQEDYTFAQRKMKAKRTVYVPGVGIDLDKFGKSAVDKKEKRRALGIPEDAALLLSVGELNENKNHETVIRAIADLDVFYIIAGKGALQPRLQQVTQSLGIGDRVKLLGYRSDVGELYGAADAFVFPSFREGLSVSLMEAMASGLPVACSCIRGNTDLINENGGELFDPRSAENCKVAIERLLARNSGIMGAHNAAAIRKFELSNVNAIMKKLYME